MIHVLDQLKKLTDSGKQLSGVHGFEDLYEVIFNLSKDLFDNDSVAILLKEEKDDRLRIVAARGYEKEALDEFRSGRTKKGITGYVFDSGKPELVAETITDPRYIKGTVNAVSEMAVPLRTADGVVGVLDMESSTVKFTTADLALFTTFGEQVATAIRNLTLQMGLEERARKLVTISKAGQSITTVGSVGEILGKIMDLTSEALELDTCAVQLFDEARDYLVVIAAKGYEDNPVGLKIPRGQGVTGRAAEQRRPSLIPDVKEIDHYIPGLRDCRSEMAVPLIYRDDVIGVFNVEHKEPNKFDETDLLLTTIFADQAASAIGNAQLSGKQELAKEKLKQRIRALDLIVEASAKVNAISDLDVLLDEILTMTAKALGVKRIFVLLPDDSGLTLTVRKNIGSNDAAGLDVPIENSVTGEAYRVGTAILIPDVTKEPRYIAGLPGGRSEIVAPMIVGEDVVGVLDAESVDKELDADDLETLKLVAGQVAVAVRNAKQRADLLERNRRLTLIHEAACSLNRSENPDDMLISILKAARKAIGIESVAILTPDAEGAYLTVQKAMDHGDVEGLRIPVGEGFVGSMFITGKSGIIDDITDREDYIDGTPGARSEMAVPLILGEKIIGILDAEAETPYAFNKTHLKMFRIFGSQVATALKSAQMIKDLDDRAKKLTLIHQAACSLNTMDDPDDMLLSILELCRKAIGLDMVAILTPHDDGEHLLVRKAINHGDVEGLKVKIGEGFCGTMFKTGKAEIIPDITQYEGYIDGTPGAMCEMAAPLTIKGQTVGILDAESLVKGAFTKKELRFLQIFGSHVASALRNTQYVERLKKRGARLTALNGVTRDLITVHDRQELIDRILKSATEALGLDRCALLLVDPKTQELVVDSMIRYGEVIGVRIPMGKGITGRVAVTGDPVLVADTAADERYWSADSGGQSEMAAPLRVHGEVIGVLDTESPKLDAFSQSDLELFSTFASQAGVALHNARLIKGLERANKKLNENVAEMAKLNKELENYSLEIAKANKALEWQLKNLTAVHEAGKTITSSLDLDTTLETILDMTSRIVGSTAGAIKLMDEETKELQIRAESGTLSEISGSWSLFDLPLMIGDKTIGVFELVKKASGTIGEEEQQMLETMASQAAIAIENARLFEDTQQIYYETLKSLAKALEARDHYTKGHSERVANLSKSTAKELGIDEQEINAIYNAALLHDIGKIGIRDEVLLAPRKLNFEEMEVIRKHPTFGNAILMPLKFLGEIREYVRFHHERWDGTGYPDGRAGEDIPLASRIIAVADTFDAMTSNRPYRNELTFETAISEIQAAAGSQFDPTVVEAFVKIVPK